MARVFFGAAADLLLRTATRIVPDRRRVTWAREWHAELRHREQELARRGLGRTGASMDLFLRSGSALRHALWLRWHDARPVAMLPDVRSAIRMTRRHAAYTLVVGTTVAVAVGSATTIFALVDQVLLRPLPFPAPEELVRIYDTQTARGLLTSPSSPASFADWSEDTARLVDLAAYTTSGEALSDQDLPLAVQTAQVTASLFRVLSVRPSLGGTFGPSAETYGNHRVAVLSHRLWQEHYGGDEAIVGRSVDLNGEPFTVVGVMPRGFGFPRADIDLWMPLAFDFDVSTARGLHFIRVIGRLHDGATRARAERSLQGSMERIAARYPDQVAGWSVRFVPLQDDVVGSIRTQLWLLFGAVALLFAIAGANVVNLVMSRITTRLPELAVRVALGAAPRRVRRLLVMENLVLAGLAGVAGLGLASVLLDGLLAAMPEDLPRAAGARLDLRAFSFGFAAAAAVGLVAGIVPSLRLSSVDVQELLRQGGRGPSGSPRGVRFRRGLVVGEVALSLILSVGAGLLIQTFAQLQQIDPGFTSERRFGGTVFLPPARYDDAAVAEFFETLLQRLGEDPSTSATAAVSQLPLEGWSVNFSFQVGDMLEDDGTNPNGDFRVATPGYFGLMEIPALRGRTFLETDRREAAPVVVINRALAERFLSDTDPVGQRLTFSYRRGQPAEIVGVVDDVRQHGLGVPDRPAYYVPLSQVPWSEMAVVVETSGSQEAAVSALQQEVARLDPAIAVRDVQPLEARVDDAVGPQRFNMLIVTAFAGTALALALVGVYAVMAYAVSQRQGEIGVRLALGAKPWRIRWTILRDVAKLTALGILLGTVGAVVLTRFLESLLFGVSAIDPVTFLVAAVLLGLVACLGGYLPARRASAVAPVVALRR